MIKFFYSLLVILTISWSSFAKEKIELIMPYAAGGSSDLYARRVAHLLSENNLNFTVDVVNKVGADGKIAYNYFLTQKKVMMIEVINVISQQNSLDYPKKLLEVIQPIYFLADPPRLVYTSLPVKDIRELMSLSQKSEILFGSSGPGSSSYSVYDWLCNKANLLKKCNVIFYRGTGHAMPDMLSGRLHVYTAAYNLVTYNGFTSLGKTKEVLVLSENKLDALPDVMTLNDLQIDEKNKFNYIDWHGLFHVGLSKIEIEEIVQRLKDIPNQDWFKKEGYKVLDQQTPEDFFKSEIVKYSNK